MIIYLGVNVKENNHNLQQIFGLCIDMKVHHLTVAEWWLTGAYGMLPYGISYFIADMV